MHERLLVCTDLDRTLLPNGPESESPDARARFSRLAAHPQVTLAYVSGRHRALVEQAMFNYLLPLPDFVVGDVGTTIYRVGKQQAWTRITTHAAEFASDWANQSHHDLKTLLHDLPDLRLQELSKQNDYKLSYYVPLDNDRKALSAVIRHRFESAGIHAALIWSTDEPMAIGLLDILPECASKLHAVEALMHMNGFDNSNTVFCGDSGNDIEVLASPIPAVLVANGHGDVKQLARQLADESGSGAQLYIAQGGFMGMNGNYSAGILEGIAHYHPDIAGWIE
jgi:HAD superfamily hydrolase (TIGR01484 family)